MQQWNNIFFFSNFASNAWNVSPICRDVRIHNFFNPIFSDGKWEIGQLGVPQTTLDGGLIVRNSDVKELWFKLELTLYCV